MRQFVRSLAILSLVACARGSPTADQKPSPVPWQSHPMGLAIGNASIVTDPDTGSQAQVLNGVLQTSATLNLGDATVNVSASSIVQVDAGVIGVINDAANPVPVTLDATTCNAGTGTFTVGGTVTCSQGTAGGAWPVSIAQQVTVLIADSGPLQANGFQVITNDASQAVPVSLIDASLSATVSGTLNTIVQNDAGNAIPVSVGNAVTSNGPTWTPKNFVAGVTVGVVQASVTTLGLLCFDSTDTTEAVYAQLFNQTTTPTNGATPIMVGPIAKVTSGAGNQGWCFDCLSAQGGACAFSTGLAFGISTTEATLTAADAAVYNLNYGQYR